MQVVKLGDRQDPDRFVKMLEENGFTIDEIIRPEKREAYIVATRND